MTDDKIIQLFFQREEVAIEETQKNMVPIVSKLPIIF